MIWTWRSCICRASESRPRRYDALPMQVQLWLLSGHCAATYNDELDAGTPHSLVDDALTPQPPAALVLVLRRLQSAFLLTAPRQ